MEKNNKGTCKSGVDTIGIKYNSSLEINKIKKLENILEKYTCITDENEILITIKPSESINGGVELVGIDESIREIEKLEMKLGLSNGKLSRVDLSVDTTENFEENKKKYRLFLECLNLKRLGAGVYETKKPIERKKGTGNFKISTNRIQTTIYDCKDKKRVANVRIENRVVNIRTKEDLKKRIVEELKKYMKELSKLEEQVEKIEDKYITFLKSEYDKTLGKKFRTFTEFVAWADYENLILTERILKELLKDSGIQTRAETFMRNFRRLRPETLRFTSKTDIKKMVATLKKELKKII